MRHLHFVILGVFLLMPEAYSAGQELEQFRLKTGEEPIQAKILSWDFERGLLTLEMTDGSTREVMGSELHSADMRLIERTLSKQLLAARKGESISGPARTTSAKVSNGGTDRLHGVNWFSDESKARQVAVGNDGSRDDKPLVWFRVLGDMTGFM